MRKVFTVLLLLAICIMHIPAFAQTENAITATASQVSCSASGSSTQVLPQNFRRRSITLQNKAGKQIRIGFLTSGTATLNTSNSFTLEASSNYIDSAPGVYTGRLVCMSSDASTAALDVTETVR